MKYTVALSLALAPLALGKAIHNVFPVRNDAGRLDSRSPRNKGSKDGGLAAVNAASVAAAEAALLAESGLVVGSSKEIIVIWVNAGGSTGTTTTINQVQTVTQTVTAGAADATATAAAGTTTEGSTATAVATAALTTHTVTVGGSKGLVYEPDSITANIGDMVVFTFLSQNHTVTQSSFATPCQFLAGGMDSGFQPNINNSVVPAPQVAMQVMVSTPLWFYCAQKAHCGLGMTFSINPTANKTQALFQEMAIAQNGTGTGGAITGNKPSASSAAVGTTSTAASESTAAAASSATADAATDAATTAEAATATASSSATAVAAAATGVVTGVGSTNSDGSCSCVVQCAVGAFPAVQAQGLGEFGGFSGSMPSSAALR